MQLEIYSVDQISEILKIHPKTVQRYIREGRLRATKIGKSWRVSGHDLSVFIDKDIADERINENSQPRKTMASSVIDVTAINHEDAMRLMNTLTASLNAKASDYGHTSMQAQYIEGEQLVRISLWGDIRFMAIMMDTINTLVKGEG